MTTRNHPVNVGVTRRIVCGAAGQGRGLRAGLRSDDGSASVLTIGLLAVVLMIIGLGVAVTGVELERNRLATMADAAALYASGSMDENAAYTQRVSMRQGPGQEDARARAEQFISEYPKGTSSLENVTVTSVSVENDGRVHLTVRGSVHPPLVGWVSRSLDSPVALTVESEAHAQ